MSLEFLYRVPLGRPLENAEMDSNLQQIEFAYTQIAQWSLAADAGMQQIAAFAGIFASIGDGLAATTDGQFFSVVSPASELMVELYRNDAGTEVLEKTYPSADGIPPIPEFGTAAEEDIGTSGATVPLLSASNAWGGTQTFTRLRETVTSVTGTTPALGGGNATVFTWALSGASTPTSGLADGESCTVQITPGAHSINWANFNVGDAGAPPLTNGKVTTVVLYRVGATSFVDFVRQH